MNRVRWSALSLVAATLVGAACFPSVHAGGDKDDKDAPVTDSKETMAAQNAIAAFQMARFGRENKAPEALLAAARVIGRTKFTDLEPKDQKKGDFEVIHAQKEAEALLEEAVKLAGADPAVKSLAQTIRADIEGAASRGATSGPRSINGTVSGRDRRDTFSIRFRGRERAVIVVNNVSNRGDIDLFVLDENGRTVAQDRRRDDDARVSFFVPRSQTFQVIVHFFRGSGSGSGAPVRYRLITN